MVQHRWHVYAAGTSSEDLKVHKLIIHKQLRKSVNEIEKSNVNVIKEMIDIRDGRSVCENLTREEVLYIIDDICIN